MNKIALVILSLFSYIPFQAQVSFPSEIKGNWLKATDSIEWYCSFQPKFAVLDKLFWNYKVIKSNVKTYEITLSDGENNKHLIITLIDSSTLSINENGSEILCTNRKAHKPDFHHYDDAAFSNLKLTDDTATIEGFIENYEDSVFSSQGTIYYYSAFTSANEEAGTTRFNIQPDGRFLVKFRMFNPQLVWLSIEGSTQTRIFAEPGRTEFICFNKRLSDLTKDPGLWQKYDDWDVNHYMGGYRLLSEELILLDPFANSLEDNILESGMDDKLSQLDYLRWRKEAYLIQTASVDSLINTLDNSEKAKQVIHTRMELLYIDDLYNLQFKKGPLSALYLSEMPERLTGDINTIISDQSINYINALNNIYGQQPIMGCFDKYDRQMQYLSVNVKDTDDLKIINDWLAQYENYQWPVLKRENEIPNTDSLFLNEIKAYFKSLKVLGKYDYLLKAVFSEIKISCLDKMLDDFDGDLTGQLLCTHNLMLLQDYRMLDEDMIAWIQEKITEPVLKKVLLENNASQEELLVKNADFTQDTYILDSIPATSSADELFNQIIKRFKGKIIYIDFWADWCSPCRAEFPYADVLKKEYAGKDLVFLYLGVSCAQDNWTNMIKQKQISGYHYWLNKEQSSQLLARFMITGIPHFLLVDKNGKVINEQAPRPSSTTVIREKLNQLLSL